ncbi:MAG: DUF3828 domain-containing protein [Muribaculaceae bacterium]|nr:DUF3828 domain-containing protein [Muribaculaceae bacterium]
MKLHIFVITSVLVLTACGNNTNQATAKTSVTTDGKHSVEYITQRLNAIYNDVYSNAFMLIENDHKYMSSEYNRLQDKAMEIAQRNGDLVVDADHWIQGQEWTEPKMTVQSVNDITENTANAVVKITKFGGTPDESEDLITLPLVFERGDWYIDNMIQQWEGETLDEKAWYQRYVDNDGILE